MATFPSADDLLDEVTAVMLPTLRLTLNLGLDVVATLALTPRQPPWHKRIHNHDATGVKKFCGR